MPIYSFGTDSPIKLELLDEEADAFNYVTLAYQDAVKVYDLGGEVPWTFLLVKNLDINLWDREAHDHVCNRIIETVKASDGKYTPMDLQGTYLIKN